MRNQKRAVIDIDNTLWHFCDVLFERLRRINPTIPPPDDWVEWDFWEAYCTREEFLGAIEDIHLNQDDESHRPYPEARDFLASLKERQFHITIASHRTADSIEQTRRWLHKHDLLFDDIHLSHDKTVLLDEACNVVVDDSPHILDYAVEKRIRAAGLLFPWNRKCASNGHRLFRDLRDVLRYILSD